MYISVQGSVRNGEIHGKGWIPCNSDDSAFPQIKPPWCPGFGSPNILGGNVVSNGYFFGKNLRMYRQISSSVSLMSTR